MLGLGIDAGGTFTDGVIYDLGSGAVLAKAKSFTTRHDLAVGIGATVDRLVDPNGGGPCVPQALGLVALSTTLATNAIVERKGGVAGLVLIGYDARLVERYITTGSCELVRGRHDIDGREVDPLDEEALASVAQAMKGRVEAVAVSSYLAARNPEHEIRARKLLSDILGVPVVCGHELSGELDSIRRATTALLNARLIPVIVELIKAVRTIMDAHGIRAPLMIVKGDGSLMGEEMAVERPVETILSGPAASVAGAVRLSGLRDAIVLDMGGTTSDLAIVTGGRAAISPLGATVGGHRTCVSAVDVRTSGLGGDSYVQVDSRQHLVLGPRRVIPISCLSYGHQGVEEEVRRLSGLDAAGKLSGLVQPCDFFSLIRRTLADADLHPQEARILTLLEDGPLSRYQLCQRLGYPYPSLLRTEVLEERGLVMRSSFTPTDALHAAGEMELWSTEAARGAAALVAARAGLSVTELVRQVKARVEERLAREVIGCLLPGLPGKATAGCSSCDILVSKMVQSPDGPQGSVGFGISLQLDRPIVGIGAPVGAYLPAAASRLGCEVMLPDHADVANAVGAITGQVVETAEVVVRLNADGLYVAHGPSERVEFGVLSEALAWAEAACSEEARGLAAAAGAEGVHVTCERRQSMGQLSAEYHSQSVFIEARVSAVATGRPVA